MIPECSKCSRAAACWDCGACAFHCRCDDEPDDDPGDDEEEELDDEQD